MFTTNNGDAHVLEELAIRHITSVPDDIAQEAIRRIAENKRKAEEKEREKAILAHMRKLEYDALPKCIHGIPSDAKALNDYCEYYDPTIYSYQRTIFKSAMISVLHSRGVVAEAKAASDWPRLVDCDKCTQKAQANMKKGGK